MRTHPLALALLVPALVQSALASTSRTSGPVRHAREAKAIAERETGGKAVSARRIPLNGASGGWEVDVRMAQEAHGWRCVIDADTHMVHSKTRIPQPGVKGKSGAVQVVRGTQ